MASPPGLYPTDLTDAEWQMLEPLIPAAEPGGRPPKWKRRVILNGIFYLVSSGCHWRLLPREYPPWKTVYHYFRAWRIDGTLQLCGIGTQGAEQGRLSRVRPCPSIDREVERLCQRECGADGSAKREDR